MIRRTIICGVLAVAATALAAPPAAADPPVKAPLPAADATGQFCPDFLVELRVVSNKEFIHVFSSGVSLITGTPKVEATNLETGETVALNISGPGKVAPDWSSITGMGRWLLFGEAGQLPGGEPGMLLIAGHSTLQLGPFGITSMEVVGHVEDVCAALAP